MVKSHAATHTVPMKVCCSIRIFIFSPWAPASIDFLPRLTCCAFEYARLYPRSFMPLHQPDNARNVASFYTLRLIGLGQVCREGGVMSGRVPSCRLLANASKAALLRINSMEPFNCTICGIFRSPKRRPTVSREVPIIWAIPPEWAAA